MTAPSSRAGFIGGSDLAAILGLSQWATPLDVWYEKIGMPKDVDPEKERIFKRGRRLEPIIIDMLIEEMGIDVTKRSADIEGQNRYHDPVHEFLSAEIDFEWRVTEGMVARFPQIDRSLIGTIQNGDAKTCHPFVAHKFGEVGTEEIPIEYHAQAQHGLMVTGRNVTLFAVLVGADNLLTYIVQRDEETIAGIREKAVAFWMDHVLAKVPPEPIVLEDALRLLRRDVNLIVQADKTLGDQVSAYKAAKSAERVAQERIKELQFQIAVALLGPDVASMPSRKPKHVIVVDGEPALTLSYQEQNRIDSDAVRSRHPDVAEECNHTSRFFRFDLPRSKR